MAKKRRLLWQLFPSYVAIMVVSLVAVTWYASSSLRHLYLEQAATDLQARASLFESQISEYLDPLDEKIVDFLCKKVGKSASTRITVILPSGRVIGDTEEDPSKMDNHVDRPEIIEALTDDLGTSIRYSRTLDKRMMYVGITLKRNGKIAAVIRTSIPIEALYDTIKNIQIRITIGGLVIAVFAALLSLLISRKLTLPIEQIRRWAESIARGEFQVRPPVTGSEEMRALSEAMNQMALELRDRIDTVMRQRNEMEAVLASMVEGVIAVDTEEHLISINSAAAEFFGCDPSTVQGRSIQEVVRNTHFHRFFKEALSSQGPIEKDIVLSSDGDRFIDAHGTSLRDSEGKKIGALIVLNDVTRIQRLENIRREFVANVSHEIKTPITAIKGFVETLRDGAIKNSEDTERFLGIIEKHVGRLGAIVEDLLSLSRIEKEAEGEEIKLSECKIKEVLENAIRACDHKARAKKVGMELLCAEDMVTKLNAPLFEQAVVNLLDNAIKYSDREGMIDVKATQEGKEIIISVRDQGQGIEKKHLPRLFERFYRVDRARSRQMGGTGLGLAIVKHIVQAHGGRVSVESAPQKGSTFSIQIPIV